MKKTAEVPSELNEFDVLVEHFDTGILFAVMMLVFIAGRVVECIGIIYRNGLNKTAVKRDL